jgi:Ca2+-binding RTX toxin-like protein
MPIVKLLTANADVYSIATSGDWAVYGLGGNDSITTSLGLRDLVPDSLFGGDGDDRLKGGLADDRLYGGIGADNLDGAAGNDVVYGDADDADRNGTPDAATLGDGYGQADVINGGDGDDTVFGQGGNDLLMGGRGADSLSGGDGDDILSGSDGDDVLTGGAGTDTLVGSLGNDELKGGDGADNLNGGGGDDKLWGDLGADTIAGSDGLDTVTYETSPAGVFIQLGGQVAGVGGFAEGDLVSGVETVIGSAFADRLVGDEAGNVLYGRDGADVLDGGAGTDLLDGGTGNDVLIASAGDDLLYGNGGTDTADYSAMTSGATIRLNGANLDPTTAAKSTGAGFNHVLLSVENVIGTNFNDAIYGDQFSNVLLGQAGDDLFAGPTGGVDTTDGGAGVDTADFSAATTQVRVGVIGINGFGTTYRAIGVNSANAVTFIDNLANVENLVGGNFNDILTGTDAANRINGGAGNDQLAGGNGNDVLTGGAGGDVLDGGAGIDTIDYSGSSAGVAMALTSTVGAARAGAGGDAAGDTIFWTIENVVGSSSADNVTGNALANVLVSGGGGASLAAADVFNGGGGDDVLIASGAGIVRLSGEGVAGATGVDTFENAGTGTAYVMDWQAGEHIVVDGDYTALLTKTFVDGAEDWIAYLDGAIADTAVVLGATSTVDEATAQAQLASLLANVTVDTGLTARAADPLGLIG